MGIDYTEQQLADFKLIIDSLRKELERKGFHIKDEWKPSGYLFEHDHYMWHLEVEECPDWRFGIWLDELSDFDKSKNANLWYRMEVFGQNINYIDKFKPTDSMNCETFTVYKEDLKTGISEFDLERWIRIFQYIKEQPYLAWYRDVHYTDYNTQYVDPEEAKKDFMECEERRLFEERLQKELDEEEVAWMKNYLDKEGVRYKITTDKYCYPCHNIIIEDASIEKKGVYDFIEDEQWEEFEKIYKKKKEENDGYWLSSTFNRGAVFVKELKD